MNWTFWLRLIAIPAGIVSALVFARDGFHFFLHGAINSVFLFIEHWLGIPFSWIEHPIKWFLGVLVALGFRIDIVLHNHWQHVFILLFLFFAAVGRASAGTSGFGTRAFRWGSGIVCALAAAITAGTVHLGHWSVFPYAMAGLFAYLALNRIWDAAAGLPGKSRLRHFGLLGPVFLVLLGVSIWSAVNEDRLNVFWADVSPSPGLALLALMVAVIAVWLLLIGYGSAPDTGDEQARDRTIMTRLTSNPGRAIGFQMAYVLGGALLFAGGSEIYFMTQSVTAQTVYLDKTRPGNWLFADCENDAFQPNMDACPRMREIPAGTFQMGSSEEELAWAKGLGAAEEWLKVEQPRRSVQIAAFAMGEMELTHGQWTTFVTLTGYQTGTGCGIYRGGKYVWADEAAWDRPGFPRINENDHPAVCLTWWDAQAYAHWLSRKTGQKYRLPSEAEWEYAARAGTQTGRYWGWKNEEACAHGNVADKAGQREFPRWKDEWIFLCDDGYAFTAPVNAPNLANGREFKSNAFGLKHMLGNVWEWTQDCWQVNYEGAAPDGRANTTGNCSNRVLRGGSWLDDPWVVRSAQRIGNTATNRDLNTGFRLARTL